MKFKDPETGEAFDRWIDAWRHFCSYPKEICSCGLFKKTGCYGCFAWFVDHPAEAARLMGYEIMDEEGKMEKENKPRMAEVLGVEVGEKFRVVNVAQGFNEGQFSINISGDLVERGSPAASRTPALCFAINHPESIVRLPRLTEPEIAIMRAVGAKWVSLDDTESIEYVYLWDYKPIFSDTNCEFGWDNGRPSVAQVLKNLFPSVEPGDCLSIDGGDADGD